MILDHPMAGRLNLLEVALNANDHPGLRVIFFLPQDDETDKKLRRLYKERIENK